jgi:ATP-dependent Lon protease
MTGEITLRGRVLPIGGLKEKILAAHRGGIKRVLIPSENEKDIKDIPQKILKAIDLVLVDHMDEVLRQALVVNDPDAFLKLPPVLPEIGEEKPATDEDDEAPAQLN